MGEARYEESNLNISWYFWEHPPEVNFDFPGDGQVGVLQNLSFVVDVNDSEGHLMNVTWWSNASGSWQVMGTNQSVGNGTYIQSFDNITQNGKWWYWNYSVDDGRIIVESGKLRFYTGYESKIKNNGTTDIKGYLLIQVQWYNTTSEEWEVVDDTINETTSRSIDAGNTLPLDVFFNGNVSTSDFSDSGSYRVYAVFRDVYGDALVTSDGVLLADWYEFEIDLG